MVVGGWLVGGWWVVVVVVVVGQGSDKCRRSSLPAAASQILLKEIIFRAVQKELLLKQGVFEHLSGVLDVVKSQ